MNKQLFITMCSSFRTIGSEWALETAKQNLVNHYLVVGVTEEMRDFVRVLEAVLPRYFAGALDLYTAGRTWISATFCITRIPSVGRCVSDSVLVRYDQRPMP